MYICLASEAWAQAGRVSERGREEQPLFMMVEDIVGDVYEADVPQTTMGSARLAQIWDNYAAATLAHSQADALPPHIALHHCIIPALPSPTSLHQSRARAHMLTPHATQKNCAQQGQPSMSGYLCRKSEQDSATSRTLATTGRTSHSHRSNKQRKPGSGCRMW